MILINQGKNQPILQWPELSQVLFMWWTLTTI